MVPALAVFAISATVATAQGTSASLTGQVTDTTGAAIPGAAVSVKNMDTGLTQSGTSNAAGVYLVTPLPPGKYSLTVAAKGFTRYVQSEGDGSGV